MAGQTNSRNGVGFAGGLTGSARYWDSPQAYPVACRKYFLPQMPCVRRCCKNWRDSLCLKSPPFGRAAPRRRDCAVMWENAHRKFCKSLYGVRKNPGVDKDAGNGQGGGQGVWNAPGLDRDARKNCGEWRNRRCARQRHGFFKKRRHGKKRKQTLSPAGGILRYLSRLPCLFVRVFCLEKCGDIGAKRDKPAGENCL